MRSPSSLPTITKTRRDTKAGRFYDIPDAPEPYPSMTTILGVIGKPALINWAANTERDLVMQAAADLYDDVAGTPKMARPAFLATLSTRLTKVKAHTREMAKAAEIGTQAHAYAEWSFRKALGQVVGPEPKLSEPAMYAALAFMEWWQSAGLTPVYIEQVVYSHAHKYAGTLDLVARREDGQLVVVDLKTSKSLYPEHFLQVVGYEHALNEMGHGPVAGGYVVRLPKVASDPAFEAVEVPPLDTLFPVFLAVRRLWDWHYENERAHRERRESAA